MATATNDELEPLGLPTPPQNPAQTLSELVAQHPLVALAASAAAGAGVMALIAASQQRSTAPHVANGQATQMYDDLRSQLGKLAERVTALLPSQDRLAQAASDLGGKAATLFDTTRDAAAHPLESAAAVASAAKQTAVAHPLLTPLVLGVLGAVAASLIKSGEAPAAEKTQD